MALALDRQRALPQSAELSFDERLSMLVQAEATGRENRRHKRLVKQAKFRVHADPERIEFLSGRNLDRAVVNELLGPAWIQNHLNVVISGSTGTGKTWLSCALGMQAVRNGFSVNYHRLGPLLEELQIAHGDGSIVRMRNALSKAPLLILDDFGATTLSKRNMQDLFDIIEARGERAATIVAGQLHWSEWHDYITVPHLADAIVDRLMNRAHKIELRGESLRQIAVRTHA